MSSLLSFVGRVTGNQQSSKMSGTSSTQPTVLSTGAAISSGTTPVMHTKQGLGVTATNSSGSQTFTKEEFGNVIRDTITPRNIGKIHLAACTKLGRRKRQEDRLALCPRVMNRDDLAFYGVWDGTVGDDASEFVHKHMPGNLIRSSHYMRALEVAKESSDGFCSKDAASAVAKAMHEAYKKTDEELLEHCAMHALHYTSSTSVTATVHGDLLTVGSLGDSKIVLGHESHGILVGEYLTRDHKPDQPHELKRIQSNGGSLMYLHGGKPFIRGGDFLVRQRRGDRPMQLNYSRAFGGKDLKPYGLSSEPDISQLQLLENDRLLILASDGLWDVSDANTAVRRAWETYKAGRDPATDLVDYALHQHDLRGSIDNVTVAVIIFRR